MASTWFIVKPDQELGPYTSAEIRQLADSGQLKTYDLVRRADKTKSVAARKVQGLFPDDEAASTPATPKTATRQEVGFLRYIADYYLATHGLGDRLLAFVLALIAMAVLSLLKPALGYRAIVLVVAGVGGLLVVAALWFLLRRISAYFLGHEHYVPDDARSWSSVIVHGGMTALLPLFLLVAVEYFSPQRGILATLMPRLNEEQRRWLASAQDKPKAGGIERQVRKKGAAGAHGTAEGETSSPDPALRRLTAQQEDLVREQAPHKSNDESALATSENVSLGQDASKSAHSKEANGPMTSANSGSSSGRSSTQPRDSGSPPGAVTAEGVGTTPDEALKDAFRNAVRQVVGAVVDAETLVKNDELISDKVLTYSDGFIPTFEEIPGSNRYQGGLHHLTIKAIVERRSVVAKLKTANVAVKEIDGKGLFAEVITKQDRRADGRALIAKAFEGYPQNVIQSIVTREPSVDAEAERTTLRYEIDVSIDLDKYEAFQEKTVEVLRKVAQSRGECSVVASNSGFPEKVKWVIPNEWDKRAGGFGKAWSTWNIENADDDMFVVINTTHSAGHDRTTWEWFQVPCPSRSRRTGNNDSVYRSAGSTFDKDADIVSRLQDKDGNDVLSDSCTIRSSDGLLGSMPGLFVTFGNNSARLVPVAFVSPYVFVWQYHGYKRSVIIPRTIAASLETLRRITALKTAFVIHKGKGQ